MPKAIEHVGDDALAFRLAHVAIGERQLDVLVDCQVVEQVIALEDEPDVALLQCGALLGGQRVNRMAHQVILAAPGAVVHAEDVQQRGLAGARRSHDGDELTRLDVDADAAQHVGLPGANRKRFLDGAQRHERLIAGGFPRRVSEGG
jgi:hypothetical protein